MKNMLPTDGLKVPSSVGSIKRTEAAVIVDKDHPHVDVAHDIRRRLSALPIANKTGALDALRSDLGIVYSKGGPIAIAITVDGMPRVDYTPDNPGSLLISDLAQVLVEGLAAKE